MATRKVEPWSVAFPSAAGSAVLSAPAPPDAQPTSMQAQTARADKASATAWRKPRLRSLGCRLGAVLAEEIDVAAA